MFSGKFFLAVILIAVATICIQWFFVGFLFHKFQSRTPATWRKENTRSYVLSMIVSLFFAFMFALIFHVWKMSGDGSMGIREGVVFGFVFWLGFSVTIELGNAIYVNTSTMFVFGKCLSSLLEYLVSGILASLLL